MHDDWLLTNPFSVSLLVSGQRAQRERVAEVQVVLARERPLDERTVAAELRQRCVRGAVAPLEAVEAGDRLRVDAVHGRVRVADATAIGADARRPGDARRALRRLARRGGE